MKFRNYCIVIMGSVKGSVIEIEKISEGKINSLNATGIIVATFSSVLEPNEISEYFKSNGRSFLIFDLEPRNSGYHIAKKEIHDGLFGFLKTINLEEKAIDLLSSISADTITSESVKKDIKKEISESEIKEMSKKDKTILFNEILDKGPENFSENDKKILPFLTK
jgi:hypothetical protein